MLGVLGIVIPSLAAVLSSVLVWQLGTANRRQSAEQARRDRDQADRTLRLDERKADREDLQAAVDIWKTSFDAVNKDNIQVRKELAETRKELTEERAETSRLRRRVDRLEQVLAIPAVREILEKMGLRVPNGSGEPS